MFNKKSFLISETLRGAGAKLINFHKKPFLKKYHPDEELAPRDVLSQAIQEEQKKGPIYLDAKHIKNIQEKHVKNY